MSLEAHTAQKPTQYSLPSEVTGDHVLPTEAESNRINQTKATILATEDGMIRFIPREVWGAQPAINPPAPLKHPLEFAIITHTAGIGNFSTTPECVQCVKECQELHMANFGWDDIGFNFLVGNDGAVYEGRGWDHQGATAKDWNSVCIGIAFMGKYIDNLPSPQAMDAAKSFLQYLVDKGKLKEDFTIHCLRQVRDAFKVAPGDALYAEIQGWKAMGAHSWAWRERVDKQTTDEIPAAERLTDVQKNSDLTEKKSEDKQPPGVVSDERVLVAMRNLEEKLHSVAQTVNSSITQAKEDIIQSQETIAKKEDINLLEERLSSNISRISSPTDGDEDISASFHNVPIQTNYRVLVEDMVAENLLPYLIQEGVLSLDNSERIDKAVTNRDKNVLLLRMVDKNGERGLQKLVESLDFDHMEHLSNCLKHQQVL